MAIALWSALRQLEAIRSAFIVSLTQGALPKLDRQPNEVFEWAENEGITSEWLRQGSQEPLPHGLTATSDDKLKPNDRIHLAWIRGIMHFAGDAFGPSIVESTRTTVALNPETDYGVNRSSASWDRWENFLTTSAMIRFLAALEQFEMDVLKSLLHYRPHGSSTSSEECELIEVEETVVHEVPERRNQVEYYERPAIWTWMRKSAENNIERRVIFSRVFGISFPPPGFGKSHQELYEMRNKIAHGRERVDITINELMQVHGYVVNSMIALRDTVRQRYEIIL